MRDRQERMRHRPYGSKADLFRSTDRIHRTPSEQHAPKRVILSDELVKERGEHVQGDADNHQGKNSAFQQPCASNRTPIFRGRS
jgi:hypothetical protein